MKQLWAACLLLWMCGFVACDYIHDELPPCKHYLSFVYDYNMKYADAFANEVDRVNLFIFDAGGKLVSERLIEGEELETNKIELDLQPGTYQLMAWGGLNDTDYTWSKLSAGTSRLADFSMQVKSEGQVVRRELKGLFHGRLQLEVPSDKETTTLFPVRKDTNKLRFVLEDTDSKTPLDADDFSVTVTTANSDLDAENRPVSGDRYTWLPYYQAATAVSDTAGNSSSLTAVVAELNTLRLMDNTNTGLVIRDNTASNGGRDILNVNLTDFLLLTKMEKHDLEPQEYLDRQDEYAVVIFLSRKPGGYECVRILVNDWVIRLNNGGVGYDTI